MNSISLATETTSPLPSHFHDANQSSQEPISIPNEEETDNLNEETKENSPEEKTEAAPQEIKARISIAD